MKKAMVKLSLEELKDVERKHTILNCATCGKPILLLKKNLAPVGSSILDGRIYTTCVAFCHDHIKGYKPVTEKYEKSLEGRLNTYYALSEGKNE